jgi:hypothetical protein
MLDMVIYGMEAVFKGVRVLCNVVPQEAVMSLSDLELRGAVWWSVSPVKLRNE